MKLIPGNMMQVLALHINANTLFFPSLLPASLSLPLFPPLLQVGTIPLNNASFPLVMWTC